MWQQDLQGVVYYSAQGLGLALLLRISGYFMVLMSL